MITKNKIKQIKSLARKKNRELLGLFVVEGYKSIRELKKADLSIAEIYVIKGSEELDEFDPIIISAIEMKSISNLKTPPGYLAVVKMQEQASLPDSGLILALDGIQDPGNLGTIIRLADWFDIPHIICSNETVDLYNPKCIQATMASIARVHVHYMDLNSFLENSTLPVVVTSMNATSIYESELPTDAILVMGSESHGISENIMNLGTQVSIPRYGVESNQTESLNVATATAVLLAEWRRSIGK